MSNPSTIDPSALTITFERLLDAAPSEVFDAWTRPEQLAIWWDPGGTPLRRCEIDLRPGGAFHFENAGHSPPFTGIYRVVERPAQLVFVAFGATGTVELVATGKQTRMRVVIACTSAEHLQQFVHMGVRDDTERTLDNLVLRMRSPS